MTICCITTHFLRFQHGGSPWNICSTSLLVHVLEFGDLFPKDEQLFLFMVFWSLLLLFFKGKTFEYTKMENLWIQQKLKYLRSLRSKLIHGVRRVCIWHEHVTISFPRIERQTPLGTGSHERLSFFNELTIPCQALLLLNFWIKTWSSPSNSMWSKLSSKHNPWPLKVPNLQLWLDECRKVEMSSNIPIMHQFIIDNS